MTEKPNLNDVATRIRYMLDGGKVRRESFYKGAYIRFNGRTFEDNDGVELATTNYFTAKYDDWEAYEEPKTEEDLRKEFTESYKAARVDRTVAELIFDTFELRKKS